MSDLFGHLNRVFTRLSWVIVTAAVVLGVALHIAVTSPDSVLEWLKAIGGLVLAFGVFGVIIFIGACLLEWLFD